MEKPTRQPHQEQGPRNLDELFIELFTPEFLATLPLEQIETVISKLKLIESSSETIPPEWSALRSVLRERGFLE